MDLDWDSGADKGARWTLDEYIYRCEIDSGVFEVLVEADLDADVISDSAAAWRIPPTFAILDSRSIRVTDDEIRAAGFSPGVKGGLLTVGAQLADLQRSQALKAHIRIVVDHDYDGVPGPLTQIITCTDFYSIESYAFTEASLHRFLRLIVGRARDARRTQRNVAGCTGGELRDRIMSGAVDLAATRLALIKGRPSIAIAPSAMRHIGVDVNGYSQTDVEGLLQSALRTRSPQVRDVTLNAIEELRPVVSVEPLKLIRGHDLITVAQKVLKSPWGRRTTGRSWGQWDESQIIRAMLTCAAAGSLYGEGLFVALRTIVEGWAS